MSKLRLLFEKQGTACYISHLDLMRTFQRLFLRGGMGDFTKGKRLFAGFRKISSEVQKSSCIVHWCTVYDLIAKKRPDAEGLLTGRRTAPVTFRVEKRTFRADGPARRGKYATLNTEN